MTQEMFDKLIDSVQSERKRNLEAMSESMKKRFNEESQLMDALRNGNPTYMVSVYPDHTNSRRAMVTIKSNEGLPDAIYRAREEALGQGRDKVSMDEYAVFVVEGDTSIPVPMDYWKEFI